MSTHPEPSTPRWCVLGVASRSRVAAVFLDATGTEVDRVDIDADALPAFERQHRGVRWVWSDAPHWYPRLLAQGITVERCHDLRLCHAILRNSEYVTERTALVAASEWDAASALEEPAAPDTSALFEIDAEPDLQGVPHDIDAALQEFARQRSALASSREPGRLQLLLAAESAGALAGVEMGAAGVPWDVDEHQRILSETLGERPPLGDKPAAMIALAHEVRAALGDPTASLDSPPKLLRALHRAGIDAHSTSRWELAEYEHPAIEPLLQYKKLARLLSANGWAWLDEWVQNGRYHPIYVPGGVVTGRWASSGGGALQLPRSLRPALRADPGWLLVSADVAQLEPRVLAAMASDHAMAEAGWRKDLYSGIVETGIVATRQEAKIAVLGALYGATTGDSGRLVPQLRRVYPAAMAAVDEAAQKGEQGGIVSTWMGRSSPPPSDSWRQVQARASQAGASAADERRARSSARTQGRFTRNFVVQGTAAEWAMAWIADLRLRLERFEPVADAPLAHASGPAFAHRPHLVFFLHDEVIVHTPAEYAEEAAEAVRASAEAAGRLLFGGSGGATNSTHRVPSTNSTHRVPATNSTHRVEFPLDIKVAERAVKD